MGIVVVVFGILEIVSVFVMSVIYILKCVLRSISFVLWLGDFVVLV